MADQFGTTRLYSQAEPARAMIGTMCMESPEMMRFCLQGYNQFYGPQTQIKAVIQD